MVTFDIDELKAACHHPSCKVQLQVDGFELRIIWEWQCNGGKFHRYGYAIRHSESHHSIGDAAREYLLSGFKRAMLELASA